LNWGTLLLEALAVGALLYLLLRRRGIVGQRKGQVQPLLAAVGRGQISYLKGSRTGPTVVLLHGFAADKEHWLPLVPLLEKHDYQVVVPDLPGFGANFREADVTYDAPALARQLRSFARAADLGVFHLVGHSIGATIAASYAYAFPIEVASLTLIEPLGLTSPSQSDFDRLLAQKRNPFLVGSAAAYDALVAFTTVRPPPINSALKKKRIETLSGDRPFYQAVWGSLVSGDRARLLDILLPEMKVRTLAVFGGSSRVVHQSAAKMLERRLEKHDSRVVVIPGAGHWLHLEKPQQLADELVAFFRARPQPTGERAAKQPAPEPPGSGAPASVDPPRPRAG
jgi:pimeloyl-ACP methyl ester carboxylesterase